MLDQEGPEKPGLRPEIPTEPKGVGEEADKPGESEEIIPPWIAGKKPEQEVLKQAEKTGETGVFQDCLDIMHGLAGAKESGRDVQKVIAWLNASKGLMERQGADLADKKREVGLLEERLRAMQEERDRLATDNAGLRLEALDFEARQKKKTGAAWEKTFLAHSLIRPFYQGWDKKSCICPELATEEMTLQDFIALFAQDFSLRLYHLYQAPGEEIPPGIKILKSPEEKLDFVQEIAAFLQDTLKASHAATKGFLANLKGLLDLD